MEGVRSDVDAIAEHIATPSVEELSADRTVFLLPPGWTNVEKTVDLSKEQQHPRRKVGNVILHDAESFIAFVGREGAQEGEGTRITSIYVDADYIKGGVTFRAILNENAALPQWRDYRALYKPAPSVEWNIWTECDRKPMSQADFAIFVEDNAKDIAVDSIPTSSQMLQMALTFEATTEARIKSAIRLQSGTTAIEYTDAEDDATLKRMEAFTRFQIGIAPFFNGQAFRIDARLKYRQNSAKLTFWYELIRPDLQVQEATRGLIAKIKAELPGVPVLMGTGA